MFDNALNDIRLLYDGGVSRTGWGGCIRKEDVLLWSKECDLSIEDTFDRVGVALGRAYIDRTLGWDFCDSVANDLFGVLMEFYTDKERHIEEPKLFWKFYLAFDYSETVEAEKADEAARLRLVSF
jgi:hypothetical protein